MKALEMDVSNTNLRCDDLNKVIDGKNCEISSKTSSMNGNNAENSRVTDMNQN